MRRTLVALLALAPVLLAAAPASAAGPVATASGAGWEPAPPTPPSDYAAGERCDFPVHGEPVVDEVVQRVLETHPDGSPKRVAYKGDLVVRVTNTDTGAAYDADASGTAVVDYRTDGSQFWSVLGPVLANFRENGGDLPRGLYILDGLYTLDIDATGYKDLTMLHGTHDNICDR
ncbi:hypothetical protein, partial [Streptomyces sp. Ru87]